MEAARTDPCVNGWHDSFFIFAVRKERAVQWMEGLLISGLKPLPALLKNPIRGVV